MELSVFIFISLIFGGYSIEIYPYWYCFSYGICSLNKIYKKRRKIRLKNKQNLYLSDLCNSVNFCLTKKIGEQVSTFAECPADVDVVMFSQNLEMLSI